MKEITVNRERSRVSISIPALEGYTACLVLEEDDSVALEIRDEAGILVDCWFHYHGNHIEIVTFDALTDEAHNHSTTVGKPSQHIKQSGGQQ